MKFKVKAEIPDGESMVETLGLGRNGHVQQYHTANVLDRIKKYMPYRTGATIKLTVAQTDTHVPEIITENPQARYLYYGLSKKGNPLHYTHTDNPLAGPRWDSRLSAAEGAAMAADLQRYINRKDGRK